MTANADHFDLGPTAEMWDASDDLDLGFDQLISRYATHRLHDAAALARLRPDLARLIAPPEVTFAAYLADGTIVLCCPDGIPESLADAVDLLDPSDPVPPAAAAQPTQTFVPPVDLAERLDILSQKLDVLQRDQTVGGQIADRLDEVKTALVEGLAKATTRAPAADAVTEGADPQMLAAELLGSIEQMLQQSEQRVLTFMRHANRTPALAPQIDGIEQRLRQIVAATADQPRIRDSLVRLHEQIDGLIARPMPTVDLSIQRQGIAHFLESMGTVIRRLDASIDRLDRPSSPQADPQLTDIANHLTVMVQQLDDLGTAKIDLSPMTRALCDLRAEISRSAQTIAD